MAFILCVTVFLLSTLKSCQFQCVKESLNEKEFSIDVTKRVQVESGDCIKINYGLTFPKKQVKVPYKRIWFRGDPQNTVSTTDVKNDKNVTKHLFKIAGLPRGEYEYGFKLEWGCNQTYVFPARVQVSVSALTKKPLVVVAPLKEGEPSKLMCYAPRLCNARSRIDWIWKVSSETSGHYDKFHMWQDELGLKVTPFAYDHNISNITCLVGYENKIVAATTITLTLKFAPKLNGTQCVVKEELLVCVCTSWGNPPSPITWPVASLTDFSITSFSSGLTVNSTLTVNAANFNNGSVKCISSNEVGTSESEILIQNYTENSANLSVSFVNIQQTSNAVQPLRTAVGLSVGLNLALLACLIICIFKWRKSSQEKLCKEKNTYASLNRAQVEQDYSVISPKPR